MGKFIQLNDANWKIPYVGGWCEGYVEGAWGQATLPTINNQTTSGVYPSAIDAWNAQPVKHTDYPPAGINVPVYFSLGNVWQGHVAIRLDDLMVASSSQGGFHDRGYIHKNIQDLINAYGPYNGGCKYLGWGEYVGRIKVVEYRPDLTQEDITEEETIPFKSILGVDDTLPKGENYTKAGRVGKITRIFTVFYSDGVQINKVLKSETRVEPVTEEYIAGTYEEPTKPETPVVEPPVQPEVVVPTLPKQIGLFLFFKRWIAYIIKKIKGEI